MSRPRPPQRKTRIPSGGKPPTIRRASVSGLTPSIAPKSQRTSKTSQKLVVLPSAPQTKPLHADQEEDTLGYETDAGHVREYKSEAERMNKEQRKKAGFKRITAYCVAESFKMKLLTGFLKREHNVAPRVFDEALYVMYHLPLLPGYGPNANVRSSAAVQTNDVLARLSEAEEIGYQGSYFTNQQHGHREDGYITSSPVERRSVPEPSSVPLVSDSDAYSQTDAEDPEPVISPISDPEQPRTPFVMPIPSISPSHPPPLPTSTTYPSISPTTPFSASSYQENAEVIFFEFGVVVFFGLSEVQEKSILEDLENNRIMQRRIPEAHWEIEECHFTYDMGIKAPRVYNDFFSTFILPSSLPPT